MGQQEQSPLAQLPPVQFQQLHLPLSSKVSQQEQKKSPVTTTITIVTTAGNNHKTITSTSHPLPQMVKIEEQKIPQLNHNIKNNEINNSKQLHQPEIQKMQLKQFPYKRISSQREINDGGRILQKEEELNDDTPIRHRRREFNDDTPIRHRGREFNDDTQAHKIQKLRLQELHLQKLQQQLRILQQQERRQLQLQQEKVGRRRSEQEDMHLKRLQQLQQEEEQDLHSNGGQHFEPGEGEKMRREIKSLEKQQDYLLSTINSLDALNDQNKLDLQSDAGFKNIAIPILMQVKDNSTVRK